MKKKVSPCNKAGSEKPLTKEVVFINSAARKAFEGMPIAEKIGFILQLETLIANGCPPLLDIDHLPNDTIELKMNGRPAFRCVYYNKLPDVVVVVHAFKKTTNGPDRKNLNTVALRIKAMDPKQFC
jgi:phage-related protein